MLRSPAHSRAQRHPVSPYATADWKSSTLQTYRCWSYSWIPQHAAPLRAARGDEGDGSHQHLESSWRVCKMAAGPAPLRAPPGPSGQEGSWHLGAAWQPHTAQKILLLTRHRGTALLMARKANPKQAGEGKPAAVRASAQVLGSHPRRLQQQFLLYSPR